MEGIASYGSCRYVFHVVLQPRLSEKTFISDASQKAAFQRRLRNITATAEEEHQEVRKSFTIGSS